MPVPSRSGPGVPGHRPPSSSAPTLPARGAAAEAIVDIPDEDGTDVTARPTGPGAGRPAAPGGRAVLSTDVAEALRLLPSLPAGQAAVTRRALPFLLPAEHLVTGGGVLLRVIDGGEVPHGADGGVLAYRAATGEGPATGGLRSVQVIGTARRVVPEPAERAAFVPPPGAGRTHGAPPGREPAAPAGSVPSDALGTRGVRSTPIESGVAVPTGFAAPDAPGAPGSPGAFDESARRGPSAPSDTPVGPAAEPDTAVYLRLFPHLAEVRGGGVPARHPAGARTVPPVQARNASRTAAAFRLHQGTSAEVAGSCGSTRGSSRS
ncbi:hypothetical protein [Streptomyces sp. ST2-7A]|uniref:hypothetical protein n=1 Tax=Streptomyces sp. ST2-7A TaxID=2907214 RepID=UPI001F46562B|nr:hypothetical protein [Streptomyces sp. ST2-7A]MCE7079776.1 hypothetical protein [Streptomyces sp. ST2-7A]